MWLLVIVLSVCVIILVSYLIVLKQEFKKANKQLKLIQDKSLIDVTTNSIDFDYLALVVEINKVIDEYQNIVTERDQDYQRLQDTIASLAHDLRTPLTSAKGYLQMIDETHLSDDEKHYLEVIDERLSTLSKLLEQLFMYTKVINHNYQVEVSELNLQTLLSNQVLTYYQQLSELNIEPVIELDDYVVNSSEDLLKRVLDNLIINAMRHGAGDLKIRQEKNIIKVSNTVSNNNIDVDRLFDRFYKEDLARTEDSSGLGLATAKEIMKQLQSTIEVELIDDQIIFTLTITNLA